MVSQFFGDYIDNLERDVDARYKINPRLMDDINLKRGLRNADGTGVMVGVTNIGSVQGYYIERCV